MGETGMRPCQGDVALETERSVHLPFVVPTRARRPELVGCLALAAMAATAAGGCASVEYRVQGAEVQRLVQLPSAMRGTEVRVVPQNSPVVAAVAPAPAPAPVPAPAPAIATGDPAPPGAQVGAPTAGV